MFSPRNSLRAHLWVVSALWTVFAVAGMISTAFAFSVLLDSKFKESGISILNFSFTSLLSARSLDEQDDLVNVLPSAASAIQPILSSEVDSATSGIQPILSSAVDSATSGIHIVQTAVSSGLQSVATDAAAAAQSELDTIIPKNMSIGLEKACVGWENESLACYSLPLNISSIVPSVLSDVLSSPIRQLQATENTVVSAILDTIRRSLIAGIMLLLLFSLIMLFWEFPNTLWRRAIMAPLGLACLIIPFLISTAVMFIVQSKIHEGLDSSSFVSVQDGDASKFGLIGLIFSALMFAATVAIVMI